MYSSKQGRFIHRLITFFGMIGLGFGANAQIGGNSASAGHFLLEGAEDLNLTAESMGRDWISDFVWPAGSVLEAVSLAGLTPATGQSTNGALLATVPDDGFGSIDAGFGIPMPGVVGASTLDSPGDMTSFDYLTFSSCASVTALANQKFQLLVECYPENSDGTFPTVFWEFSPEQGTSFASVNLGIDQPDGMINNTGDLTAQELLSRTRFLYFSHFANPVTGGTQLDIHYDDLQLGPEVTATNAVGAWTMYP
jgi:hypothetical protein